MPSNPLQIPQHAGSPVAKVARRFELVESGQLSGISAIRPANSLKAKFLMEKLLQPGGAFDGEYFMYRIDDRGKSKPDSYVKDIQVVTQLKGVLALVATGYVAEAQSLMDTLLDTSFDGRFFRDNPVSGSGEERAGSPGYQVRNQLLGVLALMSTGRSQDANSLMNDILFGDGFGKQIDLGDHSPRQIGSPAGGQGTPKRAFDGKEFCFIIDKNGNQVLAGGPYLEEQCYGLMALISTGHEKEIEGMTHHLRADLSARLGRMVRYLNGETAVHRGDSFTMFSDQIQGLMIALTLSGDTRSGKEVMGMISQDYLAGDFFSFYKTTDLKAGNPNEKLVCNQLEAVIALSLLEMDRREMEVRSAP